MEFAVKITVLLLFIEHLQPPWPKVAAQVCSHFQKWNIAYISTLHFFHSIFNQLSLEVSWLSITHIDGSTVSSLVRGSRDIPRYQH